MNMETYCGHWKFSISVGESMLRKRNMLGCGEPKGVRE